MSSIINSGTYTVFDNRAKAEAVVKDWAHGSYRIETDPKGSGRCIVYILDEETGETLGKL